jgi:hypothetical protein
MTALRGLTMTLAFALEIAMLAAFLVWGATVAPAGWMLVAAIGAPAAAIVVWGLFLAPRAEHRLTPRLRLVAEACLLSLAAAALIAAGRDQLGLALELLVIARFVLGRISGVDTEAPQTN